MTPVQFTCPCGSLLEVPARLRGRRVRCPACREVVFAEEVADADLVDPADDGPTPQPDFAPADREATLAWGAAWLGWIAVWFLLRHAAARTGVPLNSFFATAFAAFTSVLPLAVFLHEAPRAAIRRLWPLVLAGAVAFGWFAAVDAPAAPAVQHRPVPAPRVFATDVCRGWLEWEARRIAGGATEKDSVLAWGSTRCGPGSVSVETDPDTGRTILRCRMHNERAVLELRSAVTRSENPASPR